MLHNALRTAARTLLIALTLPAVAACRGEPERRAAAPAGEPAAAPAATAHDAGPSLDTPDSYDPSGISLFLHGNVAELLVVAPAGRRLGYDPLTRGRYGEIPRASLSLEGPIGNDEEESDDAERPATADTAPPSATGADGGDEGDPPYLEGYILRPAAGVYTLTVVGTNEGRYDLDVHTSAPDGMSGGGAKVHDAPIAPGAVHRYQFRFERGPQPKVIDLKRL